MAACDYRFCDVCEAKCFYDANLNYNTEAEEGLPPYRVAGKPQEHADNRLWRLGDWAVLCIECAKTHRTQVVPIDAAALAHEQEAQPAEPITAKAYADKHGLAVTNEWMRGFDFAMKVAAQPAAQEPSEAGFK